MIYPEVTLLPHNCRRTEQLSFKRNKDSNVNTRIQLLVVQHRTNKGERAGQINNISKWISKIYVMEVRGVEITKEERSRGNEKKEISKLLCFLLTVFSLKWLVERGEVNFRTWMNLFCCVPLGERETRQREIEGESIRKRKRISKPLCLPAKGEGGEGRRNEETQTGGHVKEWVQEEGRIKTQRMQQGWKEGRWTFAPVNAKLASPAGRETDAFTRTIRFGWLK